LPHDQIWGKVLAPQKEDTRERNRMLETADKQAVIPESGQEADLRQNLAIALRSGILGGKKYAATILMRITIVREEIQLEREMQL